MPPNNQPLNQTPVAPGAGSSVPQGSGSNDTKVLVKPKNPSSTQNSLLLSEVRDNMVIMADGSFRAVVECESINFDLMSNTEREGVEYSYQNFLNALNHPVQILIRSQSIDIEPYINRLVELRRGQDNMLLNVLMDDYIAFIDALSQEANIMDKAFYVVVPYYPSGDMNSIIEQGKGFFGRLFSGPKNVITKIESATYESAKTEIKNRVDGVMASLFQLGVQSRQLNTKELGELYYNFYNPDTAVREPLNNYTAVTAIYTKKTADETAPTQPEVVS